MNSSNQVVHSELQAPLLEDEHQESPTEAKDPLREAILLVASPLLLLLLLFQFGMAFRMHSQPDNLSWTSVAVSIVLLGVTSRLYRAACAYARRCTTAVALLWIPEILMGVVLGMVLFGWVGAGFVVMLLGMLALSLFVIVVTLYTMCRSEQNDFAMEARQQEVPSALEACQVV